MNAAADDERLGGQILSFLDFDDQGLVAAAAVPLGGDAAAAIPLPAAARAGMAKLAAVAA